MDSNQICSLGEQLLSELAEFGIDCSPREAETLIRHLDLVIEKNRVVNLTRIVDPCEAVSLHIVDSLLPLASGLSLLDTSSCFLDIGTGAGFPGIPLGVLSHAKGLLIDSVGKKVSAVNEFISSLGLKNIAARQVRAEDLARESVSFSAVFARAVAQSNVLIEYATPLLCSNGYCVLEKAHVQIDEFEAALRAADICGLDLVSRETYELPRELGHRELLVFRKTRNPRIRLPRRTGEAKHSPLGL